MNPYIKALNFAAYAHGDQKTLHGLPYVVHVCSVARELSVALAVERDNDADFAMTCALLHDVVEDTSITAGRIENEFGEKVSRAVMALSKDTGLPHKDRMVDSLERILAQPREVAMVKLADRITNLGPPPPMWRATKVLRYQDDAKMILDRLGEASPTLYERLSIAIKDYPNTPANFYAGKVAGVNELSPEDLRGRIEKIVLSKTNAPNEVALERALRVCDEFETAGRGPHNVGPEDEYGGVIFRVFSEDDRLALLAIDNEGDVFTAGTGEDIGFYENQDPELTLESVIAGGTKLLIEFMDSP